MKPPSREQCLEWAEDTGFKQYTTPEDTEERFCWPDHIEALIHRAYKAGAEAMREEAIKQCNQVADDGEGANFCAHAIRNLKVGE